MNKNQVNEHPLHYSNVSNTGQYIQYDYACMITGTDLPYKLCVHHDTSHASQSYAKVEVFNEATLTWNLMFTHHYEQWAHLKHLNGNLTEGIIEAANELTARVFALLAR